MSKASTLDISGASSTVGMINIIINTRLIPTTF